MRHSNASPKLMTRDSRHLPKARIRSRSFFLLFPCAVFKVRNQDLMRVSPHPILQNDIAMAREKRNQILLRAGTANASPVYPGYFYLGSRARP
jgi:hypothetical protein